MTPAARSKVKSLKLFSPALVEEMPSIKDVPSENKHIRFEVPEIDELAKELIQFPGTHSVVQHTAGKKGEHPHLHVFYKNPKERPEKMAAVRDRIKKAPASPIMNKLYGNSQISIRAHDSYDNWVKYVCENQSHKVIHGPPELYEKSEEIKKGSVLNLPLLAQQIGVSGKVVVVKDKKVPMRQKFIMFLENEKQWEKNKTINLSNYDNMIEKITDYLTDFWENAFTFPEGMRMVEYARYYFADEDIADKIRKDNYYSFKKGLRGN